MPERPPGLDLVDLCRQAVEAADGSGHVEAYAEETTRTSVRVRGGEVEALTSAASRGIGVRVIEDGRLGYAYAADPDQAEVVALVERAREAARFAEPDEANVLPGLVDVDPLEGMLRPSQLDVPAERKVQTAVELERAAVSARSEVRKVESVSYGDAVSRAAIASTHGGPLEYSRTDCWVSVHSLAERDGETQTGFAFRHERELAELAWEEAAAEAADRAARLLGGTKPTSARVPVVLDPVAATAFLSVLAGGLSAESVQKGRSPLASLVDQEVASPSVTLVDDGRLLEGPAAAPFDDEGVATGRTTLIDAGVLRGFLHNTRTAARGGTRSTGNAGRGGYRTPPGVSPTNLFVERGEGTVDGLLAAADGGVFVQEVSGLHSGANPVSGEFSVGAVGLRVRDGALAEPLREMTVASTLLDVLRSVQLVASDLRFLGGSLAAPTILVGEMTVAGT
ncbi:MAG TPA: TldD/PmbA family protein [Actinomycetota bacterium]|nr:TldD/PmbA family protein [Actinomycetota bacterium]